MEYNSITVMVYLAFSLNIIPVMFIHDTVYANFSLVFSAVVSHCMNVTIYLF